MKRVFVTCVALTLFAGNIAYAQPTEDAAIDKAISCRDIENDLERLACLDSAAETLAVTRIIREERAEETKKNRRKNFGLAGGGKEKDAKIAETPDDFGGEYLPSTRKEKEETRLKSITSKVAEIRVNPYGKVTLTLENGQVWRQLSSDSKTLYLSEDKLYTAEIKRSFMGGYMLKLDDGRRATIRVSRIK